MLKIAIKRGSVSFLSGIAVSQIINVLISLSLGDEYVPVMPDFAAHFSSEIAAVVVQALLTGLISTAFAASSVIFMIERWSFLRQCVIHFLITSAVWIPVVSLLWMPRDGLGVMIGAASFFLSYAIVWLSQIAVNRRLVKKINRKIEGEQSHERHRD